jgi:hypothetical protein
VQIGVFCIPRCPAPPPTRASWRSDRDQHPAAAHRPHQPASRPPARRSLPVHPPWRTGLGARLASLVRGSGGTGPGAVFELAPAASTPSGSLPAGSRAGASPAPRGRPATKAGTMTVTITAAGGHSDAEVTYQLTALTLAAGHELREVADGDPAYLQSWQDAVTAWLHRHHPPADHHGDQQPIPRPGKRWALSTELEQLRQRAGHPGRRIAEPGRP